MQNSELFRRGIVLPLDDDAERCLRRGEVDDDTAVRYHEIDDHFFSDLWRLGFFSRINERTGGMLNDYEDEFVEVPSLKMIRLVILDLKRKRVISSRMDSLFTSISLLIDEAESLKRPLLFVL